MKDKNKETKKISVFFNTNTLRIFNKLTKNCVWLFFLFNVILFVLYVMGNFYNFLDETQLLILKVLTVSSIFQSILSFILFVENMIYIFFTHSKVARLLTLTFSVISLLIGIAFIIYSTLVKQLSVGL